MKTELKSKCWPLAPQEPQYGTPRTKVISDAINATLKPYRSQYFSTATAMLLMGQFLEIAKIEHELNEAKRDADNCRQIIDTYSRQKDDLQKLQRELSTARERIAILEKECQQNNQAACLFDRDAAVVELAQVRGELETVQLNLEATGRVVLARDASIAELTKQNNLFRNALDKIQLECSPKSFTTSGEYEAIQRFLVAALSNPDPSSLTVLSRAEVEKWECSCEPKTTFKGIVEVKCPRCTLLERFTK